MRQLSALRHREHLWVMIHEQYFYPDYSRHQPDFEEKLSMTFSRLLELGYRSAFFEDLLTAAP
jgi:hypothetical protein